MIDQTILEVAAWLVGVLTAAFLVVRAIGWMRARARDIRNFHEDWNGRPPRPGVAATKGVPERIGELEVGLSTLETCARDLRAELHPNGGASARDALNRIEQWQRDHDEKAK